MKYEVCFEVLTFFSSIVFAGALQHRTQVEVALNMHLLEMARCNTLSRWYMMP